MFTPGPPAARAPEPVARIAGLFATFPAPWALCGGWAVDAWLGRITRDHFDVDITVFGSDQGRLRKHLGGWTLIPHDAVVPDSKEPWDRRELVLPAHIHAAEDAEVALAWVTSPHLPPAEPIKLDLQLNERGADGWLLHPEPRVACAVERATAESRWGLPTVVPEVLAFYKATAYFDDPRFVGRRAQDEADFRALADLLGPDAASWLRVAVEAARPGHPWLVGG